MAASGYKLFVTGDVLTAAQVNDYLMLQTVMVFASSAARTTALSGVLAEGLTTYLKDTNSFEIYDGSGWVSYGSGDITAVSAGTGISVASGTGPVPVVTNSMATEITAKGDLIAGTGSATFDNLPVGTNGQVLQADSTTATGLKWATAASGSTYVGCCSYKTSAQTLTANAYTAITWQDEYWDTDAFHSSGTNPSRFTVPAGKAGKYAYKFNLGIGNTSGDVYFHVRINGTTYWNFSWDTNPPTNLQGDVTLNLAVGDYVELFVYFLTAITTATYSEAICSFDYLGA